MPFLSLLSNPSNNVGITGKALYGASAPQYYTFTSAPTNMDEGTGSSFSISTFNVPDGTVVYWTISGSVSTGDFIADNGSFSISNNSGSFSVSVANDMLTEGPEVFQVNIRKGSVSGPIVATSNSITINDTSKTPVYSFGTMSGSVNEWTFLAGIPVITANVIDGTVIYWTINTSSTITAGDFSSLSGPVTIYNNSGSFGILTTDDKLTEGPEQFNISLRTGSITGPVVATSPFLTLNDTSTAQLPIATAFEYQMYGGGGGVGTNNGATSSAGGGGAGGFITSGVSWNSSNSTVQWGISVGAGGAYGSSGGTSSISSYLFTFYAWGGGKGAGSSSSASSGGSGGGGSAGGGGSVYNVGGAGTSGQGFAGGKAYNFGYSNVGGGGGGATSAGTGGGAGYSGNGGQGTTDWLGAVVCRGGGGKSGNSFGSGTPNGAGTAGSGWGGGGDSVGGGSGKVIIRYGVDYAAPAQITGATSSYITGSYRYYIFTSSGFIKFAN